MNVNIGRSSRKKCSLRKGVLRKFAKFTGKQLCQSLFFDKIAGLGLFYRTSPGDCFCSFFINLFIKSLFLRFTGLIRSIFPANIYLFKVNNRRSLQTLHLVFYAQTLRIRRFHVIFTKFQYGSHAVYF